MACECAECVEYGGPNPTIMKVRFLAVFAQMGVALYGLVKERSWKALGAFVGSFIFFWTVPRYLICARCENYGRDCYSLYLGKLTSRIWPKQEGEIPKVGMALEVITLGTFANAPAIGLLKNRKLLALYMLFSNITVTTQFFHACRHCAYYAKDWRSECPSARTYRMFFGGGREIAM